MKVFSSLCMQNQCFTDVLSFVSLVESSVTFSMFVRFFAHSGVHHPHHHTH